MLAVQKWAQDKSVFIALVGSQTAFNARSVYEGLQHIKERHLFGHTFSLPRNLSDWFKLYRSHAKTTQAASILIAESSEFGEKFVEFGHAAQELHNAVKRSPDGTLKIQLSPEDRQRATESNKRLLSLSFADLENDLSDISCDPEARAKICRLLTENEFEFSFVYLVMYPCWFLYQTSPTLLYWKARKGDEDALEKLLHLDPLMLHDPFIGKRLQEIRLSPNRKAYKRLLMATNSPFNITLKKIKELNAAFLSFMSHTLNQPLNEPQIRNLYDAVAQDHEADKYAIDEDIPSNESLTRALHRKRPAWEKVIKSDKKI